MCLSGPAAAARSSRPAWHHALRRPARPAGPGCPAVPRRPPAAARPRFAGPTPPPHISTTTPPPKGRRDPARASARSKRRPEAGACREFHAFLGERRRPGRPVLDPSRAWIWQCRRSEVPPEAHRSATSRSHSARNVRCGRDRASRAADTNSSAASSASPRPCDDRADDRAAAISSSCASTGAAGSPSAQAGRTVSLRAAKDIPDIISGMSASLARSLAMRGRSSAAGRRVRLFNSGNLRGTTRARTRPHLSCLKSFFRTSILSHPGRGPSRSGPLALMGFGRYSR